MSVFTYDTATGSDGTVVTSHNGETGATWTVGTGYSNAGAITSNRFRGNGGGSVFASGVATVDGSYTEAILETITNAAGFGIFVRGHANLAGSARGYLIYYGTSGAWQLYRLENSTTLTALGSPVTSLLSVGAHTLRISATGTGASVAIAVTLDGTSLITFSDANAARITSLGGAGMFFAVAHSSSTSSHINSITGADPGIVITTPVGGKIHQRSGTTGTITVTGTDTGTPTTIEARLVEDGTGTPITGFDWSTKVASPSGGAYSFSVTGVPQGGWYNVQVRHSNNTGVTATSGKVGVGVLIALTGQSQAYLWFRSRSTALTPNSLVRAFGIFGTWSVPDTGTMAGAIAFGNALATALSIPIGVLDYAADSSYLHNYSSNSWLPITNAPYVAFKAGALTGLDGKLEAIVWVQGESDVIQNATQAQYYADLGTLFTAFRTDSGQSALPVVMVTLGRWLNDVRVTNTNIQDVRLAQVQKCADADVYRVDRMDLPLSGDDLHLSGPGFEMLGTRCAQVVSYLAGVATYYQGPRISSVTQVSTSVYDVNLTHNSSATDFTPTSGITGFRVLDSGTPATISSAVRQTASSVRLTLSAPAGTLPTVQYLYGYGPDITGVLVDDTALALPLEFNGGVSAVALAGDAAATATSTAALSVSIPLSGASLSIASASGGLSISTPLTGDATATANATGGLSLSIPLSGDAIAQSLSTGGLTVNITLSGAAIAEAVAAAGLDVQSTGTVSLSGNASAESSATGALSLAIPLSGASLVVSSADGSLSQIVPLAGAAASVSLATGGLDVSAALSTLAGAALSEASAGATLTLRVNLGGAALVNAIASGALAGTGELTGTAGYTITGSSRTWRITS